MKGCLSFQLSETALNKEDSAPSDIEQPHEPTIPANQMSTTKDHVTVGESSGCQETSDDSFRDQPRASACDQVNENSTEEETAHEEGKKCQIMSLFVLFAIVSFIFSICLTV